eukprot:scaffold5330_cov59-Phaeocystis_antarctica.AAC.4
MHAAVGAGRTKANWHRRKFRRVGGVCGTGAGKCFALGRETVWGQACLGLVTIITVNSRPWRSPHLAAQCCSRLVISPQLRQQHLHRPPQLIADAAERHGDARPARSIDRSGRARCTVAQLDADDARLITAQLGKRHQQSARNTALMTC